MKNQGFINKLNSLKDNVRNVRNHMFGDSLALKRVRTSSEIKTNKRRAESCEVLIFIFSIFFYIKKKN